MFESRQRGVAFARDVLAFPDRAALMQGALQDGVSHFQRLQRHKKQFGRAKPAILGNGLGRIRFTGHQTQDEAAVGVGSHRRDSSRSLAALIFDGFSRSTSSRISSIARRRSDSSVSVPLAGCRNPKWLAVVGDLHGLAGARHAFHLERLAEQGAERNRFHGARLNVVEGC
jgi:hypothetical protein